MSHRPLCHPPSQPPRHRTATAVLALLLGATAAGCSVAEAPDSGEECAAAPGVSPDNLTLGLIVPDSGPLAQPFTSVRGGVESRIGLANATGGVHGRQIVLEWRDDASSAGTNLAAARDLVENSGVFGVIENTAVAAGSADYLASENVPVTGLVAEPVWGNHRNMFSFAYPYTDGPSVTTFGQYAARAGGTRALVLGNSLNPSARTVAERFTASLASQGIPVVATLDYTEGVTSPAQIAAAVVAAEADVIAGAVSGESLASAVQAAQAAGASIAAAFGPDGYDSRLLERYGAAITGMAVYMSVTPFELQSAALDTYRAAMARYAPESGGRDQVTALQAYITADLFVRGLEAAGDCPTRAGFVEALRGVTDYDADGLLPDPVDLDEDFGALNRCYYFVRVDPTGRAFQVDPGGAGTDGQQWCGEEVTSTASPQDASPQDDPLR